MDRKYRYPVIDPPTDSLVVADLSLDRMDGQIAACVLQGIVNRQSRQKIYVTNTYCFDNKRGGKDQVQVAERFLDELYKDIPVSRINIRRNRNRPGFEGLYARFKEYVRGLIIWDPKLEQATIEAATTIAGQTDGLVVSPEIADSFEDDLPVITDLREFEFKTNPECLKWLLLNWMEGANKDFAFTWSHMTTEGRSWGAANKDYVVAQKLFTYYLDITNQEEARHYSDVLKHYAPGTPILGWTDERWSDALFMKLGYCMVPYISVENMTLHASFPATTGIAQSPEPVPLYDNGVYISFFVADGDNLLHSMVYEPDTIMTTHSKRSVPLTWVINPGLVDLAPRLFDWYRERRPNDELAAMISDGHPSSDRYRAFKYYCDFAAGYLKRAGILTMKQMEESEAIAWNIQPYVMNAGYSGSCPKGIGPYEYHMDNKTFHIGSVKLDDDPETIRTLVRNAPGKGPLFFSVFAGTADRDIPAMVEKVAEELKASEAEDGRQYFFLRCVDLAATYRKFIGMNIS